MARSRSFISEAPLDAWGHMNGARPCVTSSVRVVGRLGRRKEEEADEGGKKSEGNVATSARRVGMPCEGWFSQKG